MRLNHLLIVKIIIEVILLCILRCYYRRKLTDTEGMLGEETRSIFSSPKRNEGVCKEEMQRHGAQSLSCDL